VPLITLRSCDATLIKLSGGLVRRQSGKLGQDWAQFRGCLLASLRLVID
jgi:hypothetical protein